MGEYMWEGLGVGEYKGGLGVGEYKGGGLGVGEYM